MSDKKTIREQVSTFYAGSLSEKPSCCCGPITPVGVSTLSTGYSEETLGALPDDAVINSFGCGNPLAFKEVEPGQTVLDLGSGAGIDLLVAARAVGAEGRVIGVDMTDDMIARARANIAAAGAVNVEVRKGIIEQLPVDDASVDWVISNCVINLSPEKDKVFAEIARVLKPGGRISISDIVASEMPEWMRDDEVMYGACIAGAVSEQDYLAGLTKAGLEDVSVRDRLIYDEESLMALVGVTDAEGQGCCGGPGVSPELAKKMADALGGKVASVKVGGHKPFT